MQAPKLVHGIDLTLPGGLDALFAHNRSIYGNLVMLDGDGDGDDGDGDDGDDGDQGDGDGKTGDDDKDAKDSKDDKKGSDGKPFDPDRARASLLAARNAEKAAKDDAKKTKGQLAEVLKALGLGEDGKPDPAKLTNELTAAQAKTRATAIENLVLRRAGKAGADGDALLDSRSFLGALKDIDPDSPTAADDVEAAITAAVAANKRLALKVAGAGSSGGAGAGNGGPAGGAKQRPKSLSEAIASHYTP
jgi:hypothetical protein